MVVEAFARSVAVLLLPILAFACIVADPGPVATLGVWLTWMVLALRHRRHEPARGDVRETPQGRRPRRCSLRRHSCRSARPLFMPYGLFRRRPSADVDRHDRRSWSASRLAPWESARRMSWCIGADRSNAQSRRPSCCSSRIRISRSCTCACTIPMSARRSTPGTSRPQRATCPLCRPRLRARLASGWRVERLEAGTQRTDAMADGQCNPCACWHCRRRSMRRWA